MKGFGGKSSLAGVPRKRSMKPVTTNKSWLFHNLCTRQMWAFVSWFVSLINCSSTNNMKHQDRSSWRPWTFSPSNWVLHLVLHVQHKFKESTQNRWFWWHTAIRATSKEPKQYESRLLFFSVLTLKNRACVNVLGKTVNKNLISHLVSQTNVKVAHKQGCLY